MIFDDRMRVIIIEDYDIEFRRSRKDVAREYFRFYKR